MVGGEQYRWRLHHQPFYEVGGKDDYLHLTIEKAGVSGKRIRARFNAGGAYSILGDFLPSRIVTPGVVRQFIEQAARAGWKPEVRQDFVVNDAEQWLTSKAE